MFKETEKKMFVIVKNDVEGRPRFYVNDKAYGMVSGLVKLVKTEVKDIIPTKGDNIGKTITIHNLIVTMVSLDGEFNLQLPLYSGLARATLNALAGGYTGEEIFISVYNNRKGFRAISLRNSEEKEDYIAPYFTREQELAMVGEIKIKGVIKKDYDSLSDKYVEELLPIIITKLGTGLEIEKGAKVPLGKPQEASAEPQDEMPF